MLGSQVAEDSTWGHVPGYLGTKLRGTPPRAAELGLDLQRCASPAMNQ